MSEPLSLEHPKLVQDMTTYTMLKGASNLFSPVVLQERAVLESGDVLENGVNEGIRLSVQTARDFKNDWLKLEI
jgi:hypothetical protein